MSEPRNPKSSATYLWAIALIALGVILLLRSLDLVSTANLAILFRYWPLLLIGFGLDYLFGNRPGNLSDHRSHHNANWAMSFGMLSLLVLVVLVVLGPFLGLAGGSKVVTNVFSEPLGSTRSAQVTLELSSAPTVIGALSGSAELIRAKLTHRGKIDFSVRGDAEKVVRLAQQGRDGFWGLADLGRTHWNVALSPLVPLELRVEAGSGHTTFDLNELNLSSFSLDSGSGSADVSLPASKNRYSATFDSGSGRLELKVADGAALDLTADTGSGALDVTLGRNVAANLEFEGGSGSSHIALAPEASVRLEVQDDGSGSLSLADRLRRVSGEGDEGVWETPGFEQADRKILITVQDAGSGSIQIR